MRRLSFIALLFLSAYGYAQFPMVGSGRQVYRPDQVDSLFYWFDAQDATTITTTNNKVTAWADKGPFGYDVVQADTSKAPTYSATSGPGGSTAALTFDGTDDFLASAAHFWGSDDMTVICVYKIADATRNANDILIGRWDNGTNNQWYYNGKWNAINNYAVNNYIFKDGSNTNRVSSDNTNTTVGSTSWRVLSWWHNSSDLKLAVDGSEVTYTETISSAGDGTIYDFTQKTSIGALNPDGTIAGPLLGSISEIIVFSKALTNAERQGIEAYLSSKYDLALQNKQKPPVISNRRIQPDYVDSLFYWFDAMDASSLLDSVGGAVSNNEGVATWADKSGRNWDVTQSTNGARPLYKATGGPGGNTPALQFDGSNDFLASAAHWWGSDDLTVFVVMKFANATRDATEVVCGKHTFTGSHRQFVFYGNNTANGYDLYFLTDADGLGGSVGLAYSTTNDKHANYVLHSMTSNGTTAAMWKNGTSITLSTNTPQTIYNSSAYGFLVGAADQASPQLFLQGSISEIIVFSRALSDSERVGVEQYLKQKWGL